MRDSSPEVDRQLATELDTQPAIPSPFIYDLTARGLAKVLTIHASGQANIPSEGALIAPNHQSVLDIPIVGVSVFRNFNEQGRVRFLAKKELQKVPLLHFFMRQTGTIFVDRINPTIETSRQAIAALRCSEVPFLVSFLQGTRIPGRPESIANGGMLWAKRAKKPIVPTGIFYPGQPSLRKIGNPAWIHFGEPIDLHDPTYKSMSKENLNALVLKAMQAAYDHASLTHTA